mmetsp:Transcript_11537/g.25785  ORF Transcript_11537/g.25785 Transcript_11537/m.25785 type:complete len:368 (-) Transcript_11537:37-1140(-)
MHPTVSTRITRLLGCRYPVVLPGMSWISQAPLVAAVSNAGGLGILATGPLSASETRDQIRQIRQNLASPDIPFGVGVTLLMPGAEENAQVALEEQVPVINTSLGKARWIRDGLESYDGKLICTVTNRHHAQVAVDQSGADALMVTGHEAAAHGGDVTSLVLIPAMAEQFPDVPLVAAGGFANGRGLAAALSLGADAVAMGSRLAVTQQSPLAQATKQVITTSQSNESNTIYGSNFDGIPARVLATPEAQKLMRNRPWLPTILYRALDAAVQLNIPLWKVIPGLMTQWDKMFAVAQFGAATHKLTKATVEGDLKQGVQFIGQSQGLIHDIPHVDDLIQSIIEEASEASLQQATLFQHDVETDSDQRRA